MKFKRNLKKYICLSLCMALVLTTVFIGTIATAEAGDFYRSAKIWKSNLNGDAISVSDFTLLDSNGNPVGGETAFNENYITNLKNGLNQGEVKAKKTVLFANDADKSKGYLKTNFDIVGNVTQQNKPKDVVIVSTVSSSAAMFGIELNMSCPCMNTDHYYRIPKDFIVHDYNSERVSVCTIENKSGTDLYFNIKDVCGDISFTDFSSVDVGKINKYLEKTYGKTLEVTGNLAWQASVPASNPVNKFWVKIIAEVDNGEISNNAIYQNYSNHYLRTDDSATEDNGVEENALIWVKAADGNYVPQTTNMRPAGAGLFQEWRQKGDKYGSPEINNADGCFDRMMSSKNLVKSFASDLLANNTSDSNNNNRVALINYAGYAATAATLGVLEGNVIIGNENHAPSFPVTNFVDFTDNAKDPDFLSAVNSSKAYAGNDYAAAMYAASQVLIDENEVDKTLTDYDNNNTTAATLDPDTLSKGYIWCGTATNRTLNGKPRKPIYSISDKKYWSMSNITRVKGSRANAEKIVVFIVDSMPTSNGTGSRNIGAGLTAAGLSTDNNASCKIVHTMATYNYDYDDALKSLKANGVTFYTAGYMVSKGEYTCYHMFDDDGITATKKIQIEDCLKFIASGGADEKDKYYTNAQNSDEFTVFLNNIKGDLLETPCKSASDTLGNNYSFVCNADHPVSVKVGADGTPITFTSLDAAVQSGYFKLSDDKKTIIWNGGDVSKGVRISFYSKLDDEYLFPKNADDSEHIYPTNSAQTLKYTLPNQSDENGEKSGEVIFAGYNLRVKSGTVKVVLSKTPVGDVRPNSEIKYTLALEKSGILADELGNVTVKTSVPDNTQIKSGNTLPSGTIAAGENKSYTVVVGSDVADDVNISNTAHFTIDKTANNIQNDVDLTIDNICTNTVANKVGTNGTITITAPTVDLTGTHDKSQVFIYEVKDGAGNAVARIMLSQGESDTVGGLKQGSYTVEEVSDWAWRYKDDINSKTATVTISSTDNDKKVDFTKSSKKSGWLSGHSSKWSNKHK